MQVANLSGRRELPECPEIQPNSSACFHSRGEPCGWLLGFDLPISDYGRPRCRFLARSAKNGIELVFHGSNDRLANDSKAV